MNSPIRRPLACGLLVAALAAWFALAACRLDRPGLYYDEMMFASAALGAPPQFSLESPWGRIPIFLMPYLGALKAWLYAPIFALFGVSAVSVRLPVVLLGAATLALNAALARRMFSPTAGPIAALLMAVDPGFIFQTRLDSGPTALMMFFRAVLLFGLADCLLAGRRRGLLLALAAAALGSFDKLNFLWFMLPTLAAALVAYRRETFACLRRRGAAAALVVAAVLLMALTGLSIRHGVRFGEEVGVIDWPGRWQQFLRLVQNALTGLGPYAFIFGDSSPLIRAPLIALGGAAGAFLLARILAPGAPALRRPVGFWLTWGVVLSAEIFVTRRATGPHHLAALVPLWWLPLAGLAAGPFDAAPGRASPARLAIARCICVAGLAAALAASLRTDRAYLSALDRAPANVNWDPGSHQLAAYARNHPQAHYVCVDWGIHHVLYGLVQARVACIDLWPSFMRPATGADAEQLEREYAGVDARFVLRAPGAENFPETRRNFFALAHERRWTCERIADFPRCDGRPLLELWRCRPPPVPPAATAPATRAATVAPLPPLPDRGAAGIPPAHTVGPHQ